jgi:hypothetical protein
MAMAGRTGTAAVSDGGVTTGPATVVGKLALEEVVSARLEEGCRAIAAAAASEIAAAAAD